MNGDAWWEGFERSFEEGIRIQMRSGLTMEEAMERAARGLEYLSQRPGYASQEALSRLAPMMERIRKRLEGE